jgi:Fe-S cluster assembly iron-binding protein IscA
MMVLDEPDDTDEIIENNGIRFVIEKNLLEDAKPISVDYASSVGRGGFTIKSNLKSTAACGSTCSC